MKQIEEINRHINNLSVWMDRVLVVSPDSYIRDSMIEYLMVGADCTYLPLNYHRVEL